MPEWHRKYRPEYRNEAVKMVIETSRPVTAVAQDLNINEGTLGNRVARYRIEHAGEEPPLTLSDRAQLRELEKEIRQLRLEKEFLGELRPSSRGSIGE